MIQNKNSNQMSQSINASWQDVMSQITKHRSKGVECVVIHAPRRKGKTNLLRHVDDVCGEGKIKNKDTRVFVCTSSVQNYHNDWSDHPNVAFVSTIVDAGIKLLKLPYDVLLLIDNGDHIDEQTMETCKAIATHHSLKSIFTIITADVTDTYKSPFTSLKTKYITWEPSPGDAE